MLLAGLDGASRRVYADPGAPADPDLLRGRRRRRYPGARVALAETLSPLEADHDFLLKGGVFSEGLISTWIDWKREHRG